MRKIIHCDCDSFYASVEMRDNPELRDLPIAVGGSPNKRGVVATCNYKARAYGVHSAMPMSQAMRACPNLVIVPTNMRKYQQESARVSEIFHDFTHLVEPLSLDEAFLDVSDCTIAQGSATLIATEIRNRVRNEVGITISAGIAPNKFLAKIASDWNKPDGQFTVTPDEVATFVEQLPVEKLFGVGTVTAKKMARLGLLTCGDLREQPVTELTRHFGKFGIRLFELSRGIDEREVKTHRKRKSLSAERTYAQDLPDQPACLAALTLLVAELEARITRANCRSQIAGRFMKVRFTGFETTTVASTGFTTSVQDYEQLFSTAWQRQAKPVRLLGVGVKLKSDNDADQLGLFDKSSDEAGET
ncbi:MAG: DNA polymerase IV [Pseudomonadales bacterium]|jgi:DNA polymerase-4|nr:DNA polymerase IV [Pseudomonadales bacterium]